VPVVHCEAEVVYTFDSLGYAKRLRERGVPQDQAEAHAEAARDFIMAELVTKADLLATKQELQARIDATRQDLTTRFETTRQELQTAIETQSLRLTVRLGAMVVAALGALATILKLT
jgi:hypothetical protein